MEAWVVEALGTQVLMVRTTSSSLGNIVERRVVFVDVF
jgi:hypothetical protein